MPGPGSSTRVRCFGQFWTNLMPVCLSVFLSGCASGCLSACRSVSVAVAVGVSVSPSVCLPACLSVCVPPSFLLLAYAVIRDRPGLSSAIPVVALDGPLETGHRGCDQTGWLPEIRAFPRSWSRVCSGAGACLMDSPKPRTATATKLGHGPGPRVCPCPKFTRGHGDTPSAV